MQEKSKLTLYVPRELHRKLKIKAAVDAEAMSSIVERAIGFYLDHPQVVDEIEASAGGVSHGQTHRVYNCPDCEGSYVVRDGELVSLMGRVGVRSEAHDLVERVSATHPAVPHSEATVEGFARPGEESLVPC
ncbi:MAG: hypothetical protein Fur0046_07370 [Cyanobacteria bacterium J069]